MYRLFAGPIFTEWYWAPLGITWLILQSMFVAALIVLLIQRTGRRSKKSYKSVYQFIPLTVVVLAVTVGGIYIADSIDRKNDAARDAAQTAENEKQKNLSATYIRQMMNEECRVDADTAEMKEQTGIYQTTIRSNFQDGKELYGLSLVSPSGADKPASTYKTWLCPGAEILMDGELISIDSIPDGSSITIYGYNNILFSYRVEVR